MLRCTPLSKNLTDSIVGSVFQAIRIEVEEAIRSVGEDPHNYQITTYPFNIKRVDNQPVSVIVLLAAKRRLQAEHGE